MKILNVRARNTTFLEKKLGETFCDLGETKVSYHTK